MAFRIAGPVLALSLMFGAAFSQNQIAEYRLRFEQDANPVHRAKLMRNLGRAEFKAIEKDMTAGYTDRALTGLREYVEQAKICEAGLDAKHVNPENHPAGFKELQFSLRDSLLRLDSLLSGMPSTEQEPFLTARKDLDTINRHVIRELFPRQPGSAAKGSGKQ